MRILLLNYEYPPLGGGASQATFFMANEFVRQGHSVDVLTSRVDGARDLEEAGGVRVFRVRCWRRGLHEVGLVGVASYLLFALLKLRRLLSRNEYELAHFFFALPTGALAPYWRWRTGKPYIVSLRGSDVPGYDHTDRMLQLIHRIATPIMRQILSGAEHVVANSCSLRRLALEAFPELTISVITNGVDSSLFWPNPATQNSRNGSVRALTVARLVPRKGLDTMIEALALDRSGRIRLDVVGDGPLARNLRKRAAELNLNDRITFRGVLHGESLQEVYRRADFFVLPSLTESFSMSLLEAMASGLPVVASNVGGIPELIADRENGILVTPGDVGGLGAAMGAMAESAELQKRFSVKNRKKVEDQYTWPQITAQYINQCYRPASAKLGDCATQPSI